VSVAGRDAIIFAAAAVSDFFLPSDKVVRCCPPIYLYCLVTNDRAIFLKAEHKIQSSAGPLHVEFACVPKMVKALKDIWCPNAFVVTFKLETDPNLLTRKAMVHLAADSKGYGVQAVVGNLLVDHKDRVTLFTASENPITITRTEDEKAKDADLEQHLIPVVTAHHKRYASAK
jgi:phosphopantothenate-cysteine ligase